MEVVPFIDAGTVSLGSTPDFRFIQFGAGVGIRYKTSFGPIRVDVAGGDTLEIGFTQSGESGFSEVTLTGPADFVFEGEIEI